MILLINMVVSVAMVLVTTLVYYELMRLIWFSLPRFHVAPRKRVLWVVFASFAGHAFVVWWYAFVYWMLIEWGGMGGFEGAHSDTFLRYIYFSAETYSSLGLGDVYPHEDLHFLVGIQAINGLVLIGWSVSFTFLAMQKFWDYDMSEEDQEES